jgi:Uma2 family endonuclease
MADPAQRARPVTLAEFLAWEDGSDIRYELVEGEITAMNPPWAPHARLVAVMTVALAQRLPQNCGVYAGGGTVLAGNDLNYRVPDLTVSCTSSTQHWVEAPRLVVEVLSRSPQKNDLTGKLAFYRSLPSIEEILLVRFDRRWCELWRRVGEHWAIDDLIGSAELPLRTTTAPIPLDEIYEPLGL